MTKRDSGCKTLGALLCHCRRSALASSCCVTSHHTLSSFPQPAPPIRAEVWKQRGRALRGVSLGLARADVSPEPQLGKDPLPNSPRLSAGFSSFLPSDRGYHYLTSCQLRMTLSSWRPPRSRPDHIVSFIDPLFPPDSHCRKGLAL